MIGILKGDIDNAKDKDFFAIESLNTLAYTTTSACLFCDVVSPHFTFPINTNIFKRAHVFNFDGTVITDDLMRSQDLLYTPYAKKRFLYLYHLDWPYIQDIKFTYINRVLLNENIELIARSDSHASLIEQLFKKPKYIMPEWDHKVLIEIDNNE
mgnify:CR=1 FL=1